VWRWLGVLAFLAPGAGLLAVQPTDWFFARYGNSSWFIVLALIALALGLVMARALDLLAVSWGHLVAALAAAIPGACTGALLGALLYLAFVPARGCGDIGCWDFLAGALVGALVGLVAIPFTLVLHLQRRAKRRSLAAAEAGERPGAPPALAADRETPDLSTERPAPPH